jgi:prolyl oligopeptidase
VDVYHGIEVIDTYRWLEEDVRESQRVRDWVNAQNKVTFEYLQSLPRREQIKERLTELWDYEKYSVPGKVGSRYYIAKNDGLQNHHVIYVMDSLDGQRRVLLNPNKWSKDGTTALGGMSFSEDGRFVAYAVQDAGSDWRTWKIRDIETGEDLADTLNYLKFTGAAWDPKSKGFFYAKYPDPDPNEQFTSLNKKMKVMYHSLGTSQENDVVVFYRPDHPEWGYGVDITDDGDYLILTIWVGTDEKYRIMYKDLDQPYAMPIDLIGDFENEYSFIDNDGPVFFFRTDFEAPNRRVIAIDTRKPERENWKEIIPEIQEPLRLVNLVNNLLVCSYLKDVTTQVKLYTMDGRYLRNVEFPGLGRASGFGGKRRDTETFYSFQSFAVSPSIYRYDLVTGESKLLEQAKVGFDPKEYVTEQIFYKSKDGTRVPMFITHKKGIKRNSSNPVLLYGYGGFNISILPRFSALRLVWMEMGGIYAVANIRGGGEYGQKWHESGKKMQKQNVFDDFIAAAEYLIESKYTCPEKLGILGGSNGGLLVGACMTQRPDLYAVTIPVVGVMDMLRFDEFTAGRFWVDDYGSAKDSKEMFEYLKGYSPYHNLKRGVRYPTTLITTADTDDRVVPGHSFKFTAQLQHCHAGDNPVLIRIETRAGHGSGKPTSMIIEEQADIYAFLAKNLGMVE